MNSHSTSQPPPDESASDALLIQKYFRHGDRNALEELFKRHADTAYRLALANVGIAADAEEAVQAAFLQILLYSGKEIQNVRGWIMSIVVNSCRKQLREEKHLRQRHSDAARGYAVAEGTSDEKAELVTAAISAVNGLPRKYRLPVWLHHLEGYSFKEVGCALLLPDETVRKQASLGIEQVRQALAAAGFTAIVVPELLASTALSAAPATLTASFETMIATKGSGAATGAASTAATRAIATSTKVVLTAALVTAVAVVFATAVPFAAGWPTINCGAGDSPAVTPMGSGDAETPPAMDASLAEILDTKIDAVYRRDYLSEVLDDLDERVGLRTVFPSPLDKSFMFSLEQRQVTVKQVLETIAREGKLDLEYHGDEVFFWKKADDTVLVELEKKLTESDVKIRCEAIHDLTKLGDKRIFPLIAKALSDKNEHAATTAFYALVDYTKHGACMPVVFEPLCKLLSAHSKDGLVWDLIPMLGLTRDPRAGETLISLLKVYPSTAAIPLAYTRDAHGVEMLTALTKDTDAGMRSMAAGALGHTRESSIVETLMPLLKDTDAKVRSSVASALGLSRNPRAADLLIALLLGDGDSSVRFNAGQALGRFRDSRASEALLPLLKDSNVLARWHAATALGYMRDPHIFYALVALVNDADANARAAAASALGFTRDPHAVDILIALLKDKDVDVRNSTIGALGTTRDPRAIEPLIALLKSADPNTKSLAAYSLSNYSGGAMVKAALAVYEKSKAAPDKHTNPHTVPPAVPPSIVDF